MNLERCLCERASRLDDDALRREIAAARQCALLSTRTAREAALLRARCLRLELERRALAASAAVERPREAALSR